MTEEEAFALLGVPPDADERTIKRAYHKLLRRFKPDRDPEGFRRLRDAFEIATSHAAMEVFRVRIRPEPEPDAPTVEATEPEVPEFEPRPEPEPPRSEVDADVVHDAIDRGELPRAHSLVMDERWAAAMIDDHRGPLFWATRRVGLATLMAHRPAFDALAAKYPEVFAAEPDPQLVHLMRMSRAWHRLKERTPLPGPLTDFVARAAVTDDDDAYRELGRTLARWFWRDVDGALRLCDQLAHRPDDLTVFLGQLTDVFEPDLEGGPRGVPLGPTPAPLDALRPLTGTTKALAILGSVTVLLFGAFDPRSIWQTLLRLGAASGTAVFVLRFERTVYQAWRGIRRRLLDACLVADVEPASVGWSLEGHRYLAKAIANDAALDLAFRIGRLARLGLDEADAR